MEYRTTRFSLPTSSPSLKKPIINSLNLTSLSINSLNSSYIPYYDTYPENLTISLELFQSLSIERLKILKTIEQVLTRLNTTLSTAPTNKKDEIEKLLRKELKDKLNYLKFMIFPSFTGASSTDLQNDIISHYILRLAFCPTEEERRWFITYELELFRYRFQVLTKSEQLNYLNDSSSNIKQFYELVTDEEKKHYKDSLISSMIIKGLVNTTTIAKSFETITYFRVRFQHVPDLVRKRSCFLAHGYAYVSDNDIISFVLQHFRMNISYQMTCSSKKYESMQQIDTRIELILKMLRKKRIHGTNTTMTTFNETEQTETITFEMLNGLSKRSFPLCMRYLHEQMIQQHHLKHLGRLQYRLFLKGIGLSLDECMKFFRHEFVTNGSMNPAQFEREHVYNIRHAYGQEGKHTSYTPYSCMKIIQDPPPGVNEHHGCPYKHWDSATLKHRLAKDYDINEETINDILDKTKQHHYQIACQIYFEYQHKVKNYGVGINHPNQYFNESRKLLTGATTNQNNPSQI
ncbi:unnamed protein product [Adineta steineri]|uniref:DNA primase large subunit n=1 Tax=Adineta steineri TaxID=433720 RepID=A0A815R919_9BILA|nr:unnamed protein product [Adineta steineri]CAF1472115.1 unnamed protein product [Adineta steineri]CAF3793142.1 unnamed protein product [Adineta steineri]CAF3928047.1 unnamed protein product [Adineta steineri]